MYGLSYTMVVTQSELTNLSIADIDAEVHFPKSNKIDLWKLKASLYHSYKLRHSFWSHHCYLLFMHSLIIHDESYLPWGGGRGREGT